MVTPLLSLIDQVEIGTKILRSENAQHKDLSTKLWKLYDFRMKYSNFEKTTLISWED